MLKRPRDAFDTSPASSTPPARPIKSMKRYHLDSDAFSDTSAFHLPSDSPSNPFGRFKPSVPRDLPALTPVSEHLVLRLQLARQRNSVFRVAIVPTNYTFWHLHRLAQFLFNWKDLRIEKHPDNKLLRVQRRVDHIFTVRKRITFHAAAKSAGLFREGTDVMRLAGNIKELRPLCDDDLRWEREESYTLAHIWNRPTSTSHAPRGVIYDFDVLSPRRTTVHISLYDNADKIKASLDDFEESSNTPHVVLGSGLPDDDDDDEDFALDLQQFNEPHAFEDLIHGQEDADEGEDDDCPSIVRLAEEQALVKKRMSASLPERLPLDEATEDGPSNLPRHPIKAVFAAPPRPERHRKSEVNATRLPAPEETCEDSVDCPAIRELSPMKKESGDAGVYLPDPDESGEVCASDKCVSRAVIGPRKRASFPSRLPNPEERSEHTKAPPKCGLVHAHRSEESHEAREALRDIRRQAAARVHHRKRAPLEPRPVDPEDSDVDEVEVVPRKRASSLVPLHPNAEDEIRAHAKHVIEARRRASMIARLPDPDESREIGDDRPSRPVMRDSRLRRASSPPLLSELVAPEDDKVQEEEYITAGPFRHKRRHAPLRGALPRRKSVEPSAKARDEEVDENDENAQLDESEAEV